MKKITQEIDSATLYVVATPIGNLGDISARALKVLAGVDIVAAEDTRRTRSLLSHFKISTRLVSLHDHNEAQRCNVLVENLRAGYSIALVSDAGTPLISDPGYQLIRAAHAAGREVRAVPGASAVTAALSICGLPTDRFVFEGFLPARASARRTRLEDLTYESRTLVFFEAPHRLFSTLADLEATLGDGRQAALVREISKRFENVVTGSIGILKNRAGSDSDLCRGELVIVVEGAGEKRTECFVDPRQVVKVLTEYLPPRVASEAAARLTGRRKNELYRLALTELASPEP